MSVPAPAPAAAAAALQHWNRLIQLAATSGSYADCLRLYTDSLIAAGLHGDAFTFPSLAKSCAALRLPRLGRAVHARAILAGSAVARDAFVRTSLMDMYAKCGCLSDARRLFDETPDRTLVAWNCMVAAYGRNAQVDESVALFNAMRRAGLRPNGSTLVGVLSGCGDSMSAMTLGVCIYGFSVKSGLDSDLPVSNSVLTMLVRCAQLKFARMLFDGMWKKSVVTWSVMASAYLQTRDCVKVFDLFSHLRRAEESIDSVVLVNLAAAAVLFRNLLVAKGVHAVVIKEGFQSQEDLAASLAVRLWLSSRRCKTKVFRPDAIVFTHVLTACSHSGLVEEGLNCFHIMSVEYGIEPSVEHYMCIVDLLCKAGHLSSAMKLFRQMPVQLQNQFLAPLISAHSTHGANSSIEFSTEELWNLEPQNSEHCRNHFQIHPRIAAHGTVLHISSHTGLNKSAFEHYCAEVADGILELGVVALKKQDSRAVNIQIEYQLSPSFHVIVAAPVLNR
ncbi:hypothetical protein PR202_ga00712 [Eleusine coracana subsp. coracana]|uniref:Pentatricopeptide repeat-containing protein n=1 Tax=Eleusine coracana subsp. coracana TaxID=191504 RepID=A0AAV5BER9_ELECO|nr:hypothetical protein PR202_ga00712 [Eleusine coracana subsp. coracana]